MMVFLKCLTNKCNIIYRDISNTQLHVLYITESKPGCNHREAIISKDPGSCHFAIDGDILIVSDNDPDPDLHWWIKALMLYEDDKEILLGDKEVTDGIINAAQSLLSVQFQHIAGFQDTILGHNLNFKSVDPNVSSVQILHTGTCVCTCTCRSMYIHDCAHGCKH